MLTLTVDHYYRRSAPERKEIDVWVEEQGVLTRDCFEVIEAQGSYAFHVHTWPRQIIDDEVEAMWDVVLEPTRPMPGGG